MPDNFPTSDDSYISYRFLCLTDPVSDKAWVSDPVILIKEQACLIVINQAYIITAG